MVLTLETLAHSVALASASLACTLAVALLVDDGLDRAVRVAPSRSQVPR